MSYALPVFILTILGFSSAGAQEYTATATGTTNPINSGIFSTVPGGTPFTVTITFNASTATITTGTTYTGPGVQNYIDPSGTATISFGTYSLSGSAPEFQVFSAYAGGIYGYEFSEFAGSGNNFATQLWSINSSVAPDTSLGSIHGSPISDINLEKVFELNTPGGDIGGVVTNFSVAVSVPEPSTLSFLPIAMLALTWLSRRSKRSTG